MRSWPDLMLMGVFGFVSGLPLPLSGFTLRQWLAEQHLSLAAIGLTANIGLAYSLKFLWSPLLDGVAPPFGLARFGQRRGWLLVINLMLAIACAGLALSDPAASLGMTIAAASGVAFLSATQDIAIDAWRIEYFPVKLQGAALAAYVWGYRVALLISVSGALALVSPLGWHGALLSMAALIALGVPAALLARHMPDMARDAHVHCRLLPRIGQAIADPLRDFLRRPGAVEILGFVMLFKLGEVLAGTMAAPFYRDMGFDRAQVAAALSVPNLAASLLGTACGGWLVVRLGPGRALLRAGFAQMLSMGMYFALAVSGGAVWILYAKVVTEAFAEAMADAAFVAYLSSLCAPGLAATQYALLSSLAALGLRTLGGASGFLAARLGWISFYGVSIFAALPAMLIMLRLLRRDPGDQKSVQRPFCSQSP